MPYKPILLTRQSCGKNARANGHDATTQVHEGKHRNKLVVTVRLDRIRHASSAGEGCFPVLAVAYDRKRDNGSMPSVPTSHCTQTGGQKSFWYRRAQVEGRKKALAELGRRGLAR